MKKIFGITMAAVCALSVAAFGISACGSDGESGGEVTEEEWDAAMTEENMLNVSGKATETSTSTYSYVDGTTDTGGYTENFEAKFALTDYGTYALGNTYFYEYEDSFTYIQYDIFAEDSYSYVSKYTDEDGDDWSVYQEENSRTADNSSSDAYDLLEYITLFAGMYNDFEYVDGAYRYYPYEGDDVTVAYVTFSGGHVSSLTLAEGYTGETGEYTYSSYYVMEFEFYDYGTTAVEVPEEFTYAYHSAD